jgi:CHAT domain-containing protein
MIAFHRQLAQGVAASKAMREAALGHIRTDQYRHPFYWAAFSIIGAP